MKRIGLRKQRGIGLLELMLSLAIIAILIIMATRYYETTRRSQMVNQALSQVNALAAAAHNWRIGQPSYNGISVPKLQAQGLIPAVWKNGNNASPWGTRVSFTSSAKSFTILMNGLPQKDCQALRARLQSNPEADVSGTSCPTFSVKFGSIS